jgi:hypothetical protein
VGAANVRAMVSNTHEVLAELFSQRPALAAELLSGPLEVAVPAFAAARVEPAELTERMPTEWRADGVVALTGPAQEVVMGVVVEIQRSPDRGKRLSWPVYVATVRARLRCPVALLVVCPDAGVAKWCATPVELGHPGFVLHPLVVGPDQVPVVTDTGLARRIPELAVLSALAHGDHPRVGEVLAALLAGLDAIDDVEYADLYSDVVFAALPEAARQHVEALMSAGTYQYQSEYARRFFGRGKAEGKAEDVLVILAARGVDVPDHARARISGCSDLDQLDAWIRRAATAESVDDLFA